MVVYVLSWSVSIPRLLMRVSLVAAAAEEEDLQGQLVVAVVAADEVEGLLEDTLKVLAKLVPQECHVYFADLGTLEVRDDWALISASRALACVVSPDLRRAASMTCCTCCLLLEFRIELTVRYSTLRMVRTTLLSGEGISSATFFSAHVIIVCLCSVSGAVVARMPPLLVVG